MHAVRQRYQNHLLAALPPEEFARISPDLELLPLALGESIYEPGTTIQYAYFPTTAVISLLYEMDDGSAAEVAVVGHEGMVGMALVMNGESTLSRAVVQNAGYAYRVKGQVLKRELQRGGSLQQTLMSYTQALFTEMAQVLVCNRHHPLEQQFCRWLLLRFDRLPVNQLIMSQETISTLIGTRRAAISEIAVKLRKAGVIEYERGRITLLDRPGLERRSCGCYTVIKNELNRLLPKGISPLRSTPLACVPSAMA